MRPVIEHLLIQICPSQGLVTSSPDQARALLTGNPQLTYALFQAMLMMKVVDPMVLQVSLGISYFNMPYNIRDLTPRLLAHVGSRWRRLPPLRACTAMRHCILPPLPLHLAMPCLNHPRPRHQLSIRTPRTPNRWPPPAPAPPPHHPRHW